jgi:hypothetical protein
MKKFTLLFSFFALSTVLLFAQEMTYSNLRNGAGISIGLALKSYDVAPLQYRGEQMHEINLSGVFIPGETGMPNLPRVSKVIAVPNGAEVRVSIKSMETERLQNMNIAPALKIQAIPEEPDMNYVKNEKRYSTNEFYPQNPVEISEITKLRGVNTVVVGITPFQFNPVTQELIVINNIELDIEYIGGTREYDDPKYRSQWFDPILKNAILNYDVISDMEYRGKSSSNGTGCEYLIVIPNREDFMPLAEQIKEFRTKQGIYTKIMRLDEMGVTNTATLKTWFHNAYNTWDIPPVAVLLMGTHNTNMAIGIPAETVYHVTEGNCITDNQYASTGTNNLPNMVFGRMAAATLSDMNILVSKFLEYETQPCMDPSYYQKPITALGWQTERWFQICSEAVGGYWRKMGKTPVRINKIYLPPQNTSIWSSNQNTSMVTNYFGPSGTGYLPTSPNDLGGWDGGLPAHVVTAVNNGAFVLQHRDHGYDQGWGEPSFIIPHISQLTNIGKMTYLFTINCQTGKFNNPTPCFGDVFHRHTYQGRNAGCVGYVGPTEVSFSFVNDAFAWGMYDFYDPDFLPTYGYPGPGNNKAGNWMPAFGNVAGKYFLYQSNWPYNPSEKLITYQMFTAHSDVFLRLFTEVPQALTVSHANVILAGNPSFLISANEGALIALTAEIDGNLEILDVAIATGSVQTMTIPSSLIPTTEIHVVITGQNYLRYDKIVSVVPAEGPYVICSGYSVVGADALTYISTNSEIAVSLKNVGVVPTANNLNVTISTNDPQLTINNNSATCASIAPDGTATVNFSVTVANNIVNNKTFSVDVAVTEGANTTWDSKLNLKAYAPDFSLEQILVNGVVDGNLTAGAVVTLKTIIKNKGGANAYNVTGNLAINSPYVTIACEGGTSAGQNLPAGQTIEIVYTLITNSAMPFGHTANFNLLLNADYGLSKSMPFSVSNTGSNAYCVPGTTNCSSYNDRITSLVLIKNSNQSTLINNANPTCSSNGYTDYTSTSVSFEPGATYTIKVKTGYANHRVRGWIDLNGNKVFDSNEVMFTVVCTNANTEYTQTFTIPQDFVPGSHRFRIRTSDGGIIPEPCNAYSWGQTLDYTAVLPELYPRVQNVVATLNEIEEKITITWNAPATQTPTGYNIYRDGIKLNPTPLTNRTYTQTNITDGIYVYGVTALYAGNKESFAVMSNVICYSHSNVTPYEIVATAGANGTISPSGTVIVNSGGNKTFTITPATCYEINVVTVDGIPVAVSDNTYTFTNVTANHTIHVTFKAAQYSITASAGANGTISPNGVTPVNCGANRTFTFTPANCYEINQVLVNGVNNPGAVSAGSYTFTNVTANHTISVTFKVKTYTITASAGANGTISPNGATAVNCGANQTFTFTPANCYEINQVLVNGVNNPAAVAAGSYTFNNVTANHTINVTFKVKTNTITASTGANGTISPNGTTTVNCGANQTFTFTPASCYQTDVVTVNGAPVSVSGNSYTVTNITANSTIHVTFKKAQYTITATAGANGTISPNGANIVPCGDSKTFVFTPNNGYEINQVLVNGVNNPAAVAAKTYTFNNVTANGTISVTFKAVAPTYTITATTGVGGSITPSGAVAVAQGANITFTFAAHAGYRIESVLVDGKNQQSAINAGNYTFKNVTGNHTIHITFASTVFTIVATAGSNGSINPSGTITVNQGGSQTFTFTPINGYSIEKVLVDGAANNGAANSGSYKFNNISANHTISVTFKLGKILGIDENIENDVMIYSHLNSIFIKNESQIALKSVEIFDMIGRSIYQNTITDSETVITLNVANGIYVVKTISESGHTFINKVLITNY